MSGFAGDKGDSDEGRGEHDGAGESYRDKQAGVIRKVKGESEL